MKIKRLAQWFGLGNFKMLHISTSSIRDIQLAQFCLKCRPKHQFLVIHSLLYILSHSLILWILFCWCIYYHRGESSHEGGIHFLFVFSLILYQCQSPVQGSNANIYKKLVLEANIFRFKSNRFLLASEATPSIIASSFPLLLRIHKFFKYASEESLK